MNSITIKEENLTMKEMDAYSGIQSPIQCETLKYFTAFSVLMFGSSLLFNSLLLFAFYKNKALRTPMNMYIMAITICNLFATSNLTIV